MLQRNASIKILDLRYPDYEGLPTTYYVPLLLKDWRWGAFGPRLLYWTDMARDAREESFLEGAVLCELRYSRNTSPETLDLTNTGMMDPHVMISPDQKPFVTMITMCVWTVSAP
jgi:hypothetical protein